MIKMEGVNHINTYVLLIGSSTFPNDTSINDIPNVTVNLQLLQDQLLETSLVGIPASNIMVSLNEDCRMIQKKLLEISKLTKSKQTTLLIYYSGHGIMSAVDYELYLATKDTTTELLEIEGVNIETFKKYVKMSRAGRKIVILDCCHSGHIIGSMGSMSSKLQSEIQGFEGTFVMTSSADDEPSLFPDDFPDKPTSFTGKLLDVISNGIEDATAAYSSLEDIFEEIKNDFAIKGLPKPQQSSFNNAGELLFAKNKKFSSPKSLADQAWENALQKDVKNDYLEFIENFPASSNLKNAMDKIAAIEEKEYWDIAVQKNTISAYLDFRMKFPDGKFSQEATKQIKLLKENTNIPVQHNPADKPVSEPSTANKITIPETAKEPKSEKKMEEPKKVSQHQLNTEKVNDIVKQPVLDPEINPTEKVLQTFTGFNCLKFKDRNSYFYLDISIGTADVLVRKNSIEIKNIMMTLKINGIKSIRYLDADKDKSLAYNFVQIDFAGFEKKPVLWNEELRIVLFKLSYTGSKPTLKLYNDLMAMVKKGQLQLEK